MDEERKRLRLSFDADPEAYDLARPGYPEQLYDDIVFWCRLGNGSKLLEIGCGTGKATVAFAERGYSVDAVEVGEQMSRFTAGITAGHRVKVVNVAFEDWEAPSSFYDLAFAATSFHWTDQRVSLMKVHRAIRGEGHFAAFWHSHVVTDRTSDAFGALQKVYEERAPPIASVTFRKQVEKSSPEFHSMLSESGLFEDIHHRKYHFTKSYDADAYIRLLSTYSDHITLEGGMKKDLFSEIGKVIDGMPGGTIIKEYETVLYTAKKIEGV